MRAIALFALLLARAVAYTSSWRSSPFISTWPQRAGRGRRLQCMSSESQPTTPTPPVSLRCLSRQQVVDKLNAVPVFSLVNGAEQIVATPDGAGDLVCRFYLEIKEAQAALEELCAANPRTAINMAVTPLGTAFALSEWQTRSDASDAAADSDDDDDFYDDDDYYDDERSEASAVAVRLQAAQEEVESVRGLLKKSPVPPLLRRRNVLEGPIPLFGSDQIRFQLPSEDDAKVDAMMPLFFRRRDLLEAWAASGGTAENLPDVQVADLRTIAWQMQYERHQDWLPMLFVAPEPAIEFVKAQQAAEEAAEATANSPELSKADVQGLLFPGERPGLFPS